MLLKWFCLVKTKNYNIYNLRKSLFRTLLLSENVDLPPLKFVPEKNSFLKRKQVTSAQLLCV